MKQPSTNRANMACVSGSNIKATCILLHGSFHGGWCWEKLLPHLPPAWDVQTPSLAMDADVDLSTHIDAGADMLSAADDGPLFVMAHSYAGMVLPGAVAKARRTPTMSFFLDAFAPRRGQTAFDDLGPMADAMRLNAADNMLAPPPAAALGIDDPGLAAWAEQHMVPMPIATHEQACEVGAFDIALGHKIYIRCTGFPGFAATETRAEIAGWALWSINSGHDAMITAPEELADIVIGLADQVLASS